ncbi:MAG: nitrous oxide reductase family maturation protein NosD [Holophagales bacterium]|nr:MAG: nitrous oxide reductase family maturation protein NosD [Holophagales bacterium]
MRARLLALAVGALVAAGGASADEAAPPAQNLEGRPGVSETSPLQARIDAAAPGATVEVAAGTWTGDLWIDKPLRLVGRGRPRLVGSSRGSVVRVRAAEVTVEGFDIDGRGGGDLARDTAGVHVAAARATVRDCRIAGCLFGIYLRASDDATVAGCTIAGIPGKDPGEKGSGIHVWNSQRFRLERNEIRDVRDGFYIQSSSGGVVRGNVARDLRYGLHYMFSDDNLFEDNLFENGAAGTALMYSKRITFRRNRFVRNRGFASVGLLLKACDEVVAEDNLIADNARGIFLEGSYDNVFRGNVVAASDVALVIYDSCARNAFTGNSFVGNLSPLSLSGRRTDTRFEGNFWSDASEPDLDGDGRSDRPYRLSSVFDHLRGNLTAADLLAQSLAARALGAAELAFPVLAPVAVEDVSPLARAPELAVPEWTPRGRSGADPAGMLGALALLSAGGATLARGRRRR